VGGSSPEEFEELVFVPEDPSIVTGEFSLFLEVDVVRDRIETAPA
jgi:hypothetical protein